jgi:hypothetical protein
MLDKDCVARSLAIGCPRIRGTDGPDCGMLWRLPTLGSTPDRLCVVYVGLAVHFPSACMPCSRAAAGSGGAFGVLSRQHGTKCSARVSGQCIKVVKLDSSSSMYWFAYILTNTSSYSKCAHVHRRRNRNECASQAHNAILPSPTSSILSLITLLFT